ncbi:PDZ domain-containing protein [Sphingomonas montana]|uniref:PDZ domain-containing protein n=1 Tax=Sphingomonas montana TaxID=1843236 RepID=UPI00096CA38F|nr:PDZ domain-containing protein [Sphingomonas montana]
MARILPTNRLPADPATRRRVAIGAGLVALLAIAVYAAAPVSEPAPEPSPAASLPPLPEPVPPPATLPLPPAPPPSPPQPTAILRGSVPGLSVNATFATRGGGGSILVTRADGTRGIVATGTDVVPGTRLTGVAADRATFTAGATRFWMPLQSEAAAKADPGPATVMAAAPPPPAPVAQPASASELRESMVYQSALTPGADGVHRGYTVRAMPPLFAKAGLKPGDIITGINGRAFDGPAEIATLAREAAISSTVVFRIRRDGQTQELQVQPR